MHQMFKKAVLAVATLIMLLPALVFTAMAWVVRYLDYKTNVLVIKQIHEVMKSFDDYMADVVDRMEKWAGHYRHEDVTDDSA